MPKTKYTKNKAVESSDTQELVLKPSSWPETEEGVFASSAPRRETVAINGRQYTKVFLVDGSTYLEDPSV